MQSFSVLFHLGSPFYPSLKKVTMDFFVAALAILGFVVGATGASFLFFCDKVIHIKREIADNNEYLFKDIKKMIDEGRIEYQDLMLEGSSVCALLKLKTEGRDLYGLVVNGNYKTVHLVDINGLNVMVRNYKISFMQEKFFSIQDLINYINHRTKFNVKLHFVFE